MCACQCTLDLITNVPQTRATVDSCQVSMKQGKSATSSSTDLERLRREDFVRTKHDSAFSPWKILIGASDWEHHSMRKDGAERYRTQNLPYSTSCPGVYELGIATLRQEQRRIDSISVVPVYLGQADNVRTRLQQYGRDGAHLEINLFLSVFSRGLPIVYRCAPMKCKRDAEITEKQLLDTFDYAWNKGGNGFRRQDDICYKIDRRAKASRFTILAKKLLIFHQKRAGIKIEAFSAPAPWQKNSSDPSKADNNSISSGILGIRRLQPREVESEHRVNICGVLIDQESVCTEPPVKGRKRCAVHKGMRINGFYVSKLDKEVKGHSSVGFEDRIRRETHQPCNKRLSPACGFILNDGSRCRSEPFRRNKRCLSHKGRRIRTSQPEC